MNTSTRFGPSSISDWFWDIIQRADKDQGKLESILHGLSDNEVHRFALEFMAASHYLCGRPYIDHIYRGHLLSEDDIADMSYWVVSQGREFYMTVMDHPEALSAYEAADSANLASAHSFEFVAEAILEERLGEWPDIMEDCRVYGTSGYMRVSDYWEARLQREQQ